MKAQRSDRRRFLKESAALASLALGAAKSVRAETTADIPDSHLKDLHAYGERSRFETDVRVGHNGFSNPRKPESIIYGYGGTLTPLQDSIGIITPASLHYFVHHNNEPPDINPREHRLMIHGLVEHPLIFTMDDLKRLPSVTRIHFLECRGNSDPQHKGRRAPTATVQLMHGQTSCSEWTGIPLSLLLREAGVKKSASWLLAEGADTGKMTRSIPLEKPMDDVLLAYGQNGEAVRPDQGYPLRMVVPGWEGNANVKWLRRIKVVDQPYMTRPETVQYPDVRPDGKGHWFNFQVGPKSVITRPSGGHLLQGRGFYEIIGLAWSGGGAIRSVEVSGDGGRTWNQAELQQPIHRKAHTRFRFGWNWIGGEALLQSRSTDDRGEIQPTHSEIAKIWGLPSDYFRSSSFQVAGHFGHFNAIQSWKVMPDGRVENAMFS